MAPESLDNQPQALAQVALPPREECPDPDAAHLGWGRYLLWQRGAYAAEWTAEEQEAECLSEV